MSAARDASLREAEGVGGPSTFIRCYQFFESWRKNRFELFVWLLKPLSTEILLDVGGYPGFWASQPLLVRHVDTVNVHKVFWANPEGLPIRALVGDGCALPMEDNCYDIGYSNSVIEHVGSWERQQQFATEIRRVAKRLWVQTRL